MTPEEKAALERLDTAIADVMKAHGWADGTMVTTSWVVLVHDTGFDDDGSKTSGYSRLYRNGEMDDHAVIGLLEVNKHRILNGHVDD
jgi:hypothetical protein